MRLNTEMRWQLRHCFEVLTVIFSLLLSPLVCAWSGQVHSKIGAATYILLDENEQSYYDELALYLPNKKASFYTMSAWVDSVRNEPIYEVFNEQVPAALVPFQQRHSGTWHYENSFYTIKKPLRDPNEPICRMQNNGKLEEALIAIDTALSESLTKQQEAILVAFGMHLFEDYHQPLHTTSLVRDDCSHDRGGNLYCLEKYNGRCVMNLHKLWDKGFGAANNQGLLNALQLPDPSPLPLSTELALLQAKGRDLAQKAYETPEYRIPHPDYMGWAKTQSEQKIKQSIYRTTHFLKLHYERTSRR